MEDQLQLISGPMGSIDCRATVLFPSLARFHGQKRDSQGTLVSDSIGVGFNVGTIEDIGLVITGPFAPNFDPNTIASTRGGLQESLLTYTRPHVLIIDEVDVGALCVRRGTHTENRQGAKASRDESSRAR